MRPILISACLVGEPCRYDGKKKPVHPVVQSWEEQGRLIKICPETDGGLPTPRPPCEIIQGNGYHVIKGQSFVCTRQGKNCTDSFMKGAFHALDCARRHKITLALLKEKSPSCGSCYIYDGTFSKRLIFGAGVTSALLRSNGIMVCSEIWLP